MRLNFAFATIYRHEAKSCFIRDVYGDKMLEVYIPGSIYMNSNIKHITSKSETCLLRVRILFYDTPSLDCIEKPRAIASHHGCPNSQLPYFYIAENVFINLFVHPSIDMK